MDSSDSDDSDDNNSCKHKFIENKILIITNICSFIIGYGIHFSLHHS